MQQLSQDSTRKLLKHRSNLCLSMFIPAQSEELCKKNFIRLRNEAWTKVEDAYDRQEIEAVFACLNLKEVLEKVNPDFDTLCLFASKRAAFFVYLDLKIPARVVVDRSFYLKPLILTISGEDQYWLLEVHEDRYVLSLASLSGGFECVQAVRTKAVGRHSPELKYLISLLNTDHRPWFIAGAAEEVREARLELSQAQLLRAPCAHLLHSSRSRLQESAREVVRLRAQRESELTQSRLSFKDIQPLMGTHGKIARLYEDGFQMVVVDKNLEVQSDAYSDLLGLDRTEEDLLVDDYVEDALERKIKVVAISRLEEKIGEPIAAVKIKKAVMQ